MKGSIARSKKLLALFLVLTMVFGAASTLAAIELPLYTPVDGQEVWEPAYTTEGSSNIITLNKKVTARPEADTWDIVLDFIAETKIESAPMEVALVIDRSGSMNLCTATDHGANKSSCGHTGVTKRKTVLVNAADNLLTKLYGMGDVSVSVSSFDGSASTNLRMKALSDEAALTTAKNSVRNAVNSCSGYTNMAGGINKGVESFSDRAVAKCIIIISDGQASAGGTGNEGEGNSSHAEAAKTAASAAKQKGIELYSVGLCTNNDADTTLAACASSSAHFFGANDEVKLNAAFSTIAASISAMVFDTINTNVFDMPGVGDFKATLSNDGASGRFVVEGSQMKWFPSNGEVAADVKVTIQYSLTLKELPKAGAYPNTKTSDTVLQYQYDKAGGSSVPQSGPGCNPGAEKISGTADFPATSVKFETGETQVHWSVWEQGNAYIIATDDKPYTSKRVITDFDGKWSASMSDVVYPSEIELPLAMKKWASNNVLYTILDEDAVDGSGMKTTSIITSGLAFDDSLKTEQEGTFTVRQLTGKTVLIYYYDGQDVAELKVSKSTYDEDGGQATTGETYTIDIFEVGEEKPYTSVELLGGETATVSLPAGVAFYAKEAQPKATAGGYEYVGTENGFVGSSIQTGLTSQEFTLAKGDSVKLAYDNGYKLLPETISFEIAKTVVVDASTDPVLPEAYTFEVTYNGADAPSIYRVAPEGTTTVTVPAGAKNIVVREVTSAAQIAGYSLSVASSFYHTNWSPKHDWSSESYQFVAGATSTALDEMLAELDGIVFQNTYTAGGGLTDFDPVVIPLGAPEIPLGPPMTGGEVTAYGWAFVILAMAAALGIVAIRKQRA